MGVLGTEWVSVVVVMIGREDTVLVEVVAVRPAVAEEACREDN